MNQRSLRKRICDFFKTNCSVYTPKNLNPHTLTNIQQFNKCGYYHESNFVILKQKTGNGNL